MLTSSYEDRYLQVCHTCEELANLADKPKVVLASMPSMECGLSSELLTQWAEDAKNMIILTDHPKVSLSQYGIGRLNIAFLVLHSG